MVQVYIYVMQKECCFIKGTVYVMRTTQREERGTGE